jgi:hypothetical protein
MNDKLKPVRAKIVIDQVEVGGSQLMNCFFLPTDVDGAYNLYNSEATLLAANVVSGQDFNFTVDGVHFHIDDFRIDETAGSGKWKIRGDKPTAEPGGTFQASSGGGVEGEVTSDVATTLPLGAIVIDKVTGSPDKDKLKGCYFTVNGVTYNLYSKNGKLLQSGISNGTNFTFNHDKNPLTSTDISWTVSSFLISQAVASGNWTNTDTSITAEQGGTFQASSGGGVEEDEAAAGASA